MKHLLILSFLIVSSPAFADVVLEIIACECSGESFEGQKAVCGVIKQRMMERGQTAEQVVTAKKQFSCWNGQKVIRKLTKKEIETAKRAWEESKPEGFNHYYAHKIVNPSWAKTWKRREVIGNHTFLKL
jgi:spore germination cell wall hydrolase CwlJ-like protein